MGGLSVGGVSMGAQPAAAPTAAFVVDHTRVVMVDGLLEPDNQARYEYVQHFGKLDVKDLKRRYRVAEREATRLKRIATASHFGDPPAAAASASVARAPKRPLVQLTLDGRVVDAAA